jgi:hypothetical protein
MAATVIRMTPETVPPVSKFPDQLIVLLAFDRDAEGSLQPVFEPREMPDERRAIATARDLARRHVGVITWRREANFAQGEYGPAEILYQDGEVPDLD